MRIKQFLAVLILLFTGCEEKNNVMEIKYFSLNDFDANYVFNLKNNKEGIKKMNDYAINYVFLSKKHNDSLKLLHININRTKPPTFNDVLKGNLPSVATDLVFYKPPGEYTLKSSGISDILLVYKIEQESYRVKGIEVPNTQMDAELTIIEIEKEENTRIFEYNRPLNLEVLKSLIVKISDLNYHNKIKNYTYVFKNRDNLSTICFLYEEYGDYLSLTF
ncbi:MAG: hypothetical protein JKY08_09715 [Flavobacteriaceae bacterium]|nr:hypothetical protein [Flavobacteriaceae bacterium]